MKKWFVSQLKSGQAVTELFVLAEKTLSHKKDGAPYLSIALSDKTGRVRGVVWDNVEQIADAAAAGDVVRVQGNVSEYRGGLQVVVKELEPAETGADPADFLPATRRNPEQMLERIIALGQAVSSDVLRGLLDAFWNDASFVAQFKKAPAAKKMHHAYIGGLLEHSLSLSLLADRVAGHYSGIDRDLLITGAILHDIGKINEFVFDTSIDYSSEGRLVNHIVIGVGMLEEKIRQIPDFPQKTALLLRHMMVSHHGSRELGSPEPPKTLEAVLLNYLDEIDAKINGIREFMESQDAGAEWTGYHKPLERFFYRGGPETTG
ncbi:MAG: OB-fold nucleic acid binding domain-containing protein [Desulfosalsimonas sp.]|uniref:3'-5' exoribonuclease YhaM family protein n=1 Tax=Desulfosalsimonas sp. TaxID=3073848 RepID=UPI003970D51E